MRCHLRNTVAAAAAAEIYIEEVVRGAAKNFPSGMHRVTLTLSPPPPPLPTWIKEPPSRERRKANALGPLRLTSFWSSGDACKERIEVYTCAEQSSYLLCDLPVFVGRGRERDRERKRERERERERETASTSRVTSREREREASPLFLALGGDFPRGYTAGALLATANRLLRGH